MVSLLTGPRGSGKTTQLIEMIDSAYKKSAGHVVCVDKAGTLRNSVTYRVRLVTADQYGISGFDAFYGLLCGLCAGDHDITDILCDATLRIGSRDYKELGEFLKKVASLSEKSGTDFVFTISTEKENIPADAAQVCEFKN
jgi:energy-coupling factor transporter ATP-binding protein EcfA2